MGLGFSVEEIGKDVRSEEKVCSSLILQGKLRCVSVVVVTISFNPLSTNKN